MHALFELWCGRGVTRLWSTVYQRPELSGLLRFVLSKDCMKIKRSLKYESFDGEFLRRAHISPVVAQECYSTPRKERPHRISEM